MKDYVKRQITMYNTTYLGHSDASCSPHQPELLCYECAYVDESGSLENWNDTLYIQSCQIFNICKYGNQM